MPGDASRTAENGSRFGSRCFALATPAVISSDIPTRPFAITPPAPGVLPERPAGEADLQDWFQAEHQVMLQAITQAAATGFITQAWQIFFGQAWWMGGQGIWTEFLATANAVLAAAEAAGDQVALGWTYTIIGRYGTFTSAHDEDRAHLARALDHFRLAGDLSGQAWTHLSASTAYMMKRDWAEAASQCEPALTLFRQNGDQPGKG
jgi:hypothetical protein